MHQISFFTILFILFYEENKVGNKNETVAPMWLGYSQPCCVRNAVP